MSEEENFLGNDEKMNEFWRWGPYFLQSLAKNVVGLGRKGKIFGREWGKYY